MEPKKENKLDMTSEEINHTDSSGLKHGLWRHRDSNGQLWLELNYVNGKAQGLWRSWYSHGQLMLEMYHANGIQEGEEIHYEYQYEYGQEGYKPY